MRNATSEANLINICPFFMVRYPNFRRDRNIGSCEGLVRRIMWRKMVCSVCLRPVSVATWRLHFWRFIVPAHAYRPTYIEISKVLRPYNNVLLFDISKNINRFLPRPPEMKLLACIRLHHSVGLFLWLSHKCSLVSDRLDLISLQIISKCSSLWIYTIQNRLP